jgi:hypothetical protein
VFCPRKSTINQIFGLQQVLEKIKEFRISIYLLFIDLTLQRGGTSAAHLAEKSRRGGTRTAGSHIFDNISTT